MDFQTTLRLHLIQTLDKSVLLSVLISPLGIKQQATDTSPLAYFPFYSQISNSFKYSLKKSTEEGGEGEEGKKKKPNKQPSPSSDSNYKRRVALTNFQHFAPRTVQQPLFLCVFVYSMSAPAGGCLPVGCRRCRCRSCPRPLRAARRGAEQRGAERGREAGVTDRERGRGRGAREAGARRGASQRPPRGVGLPLPLPGRYVHGSKPRKSPLPSSPSLPGCRAGRGAAAEERSLPRSPSSPGGETFRRVRGSSQINHGAALLYQLDFSGTDGIKTSSAF